MLRDLVCIAVKSIVLAAAGLMVVTCSPRTHADDPHPAEGAVPPPRVIVHRASD